MENGEKAVHLNLKRVLKPFHKVFVRPFQKLFLKILRFFPKAHTCYLYYNRFHKSLDLANPQSLNEKILWLKFHEYHKDIYTQCADKYAVREYVEKKQCGEILNNLIAIYDHPDEIDFSILPKRFALKCNHGAGYNIICFDKATIDIQQVKRQLSKWLKQDYSQNLSEPQYKNIPRKIICEEFIENNGQFPDDFKFYCFDGKPEIVMLCRERKNNATKFYYFDMDWNLLPLNDTSKDALANSEIIQKPDGFEKLKSYASILSKDFLFVRADFYLLEGKPLFGELTFTPAAGLDRDDIEANNLLGELLKLPMDSCS